jgi:dTDP-4-amino-4,6-dideoxygalactose transaminase
MKNYMQVRFVDLPRQNKILKTQLIASIKEVVEKADFTMGPRLSKFELEFAQFCNKKYAVGVNSGTDALLLSLMAYGIGKGDEVIVPPNSYFSTAMVVSNIGAKLVFVDINPKYYTIDVEKIEKAITPKTKAIIPVHLYGQPADMDKIMEIAKKYNLVVIEDACQAHGAMYKKKMIPYGETGAFSFFPGKNLGCFGDGGIVVTDNKKIAEKILYLRNDGSYKKYLHPMFGIKSRLDTLQAVVLSVKLPNLKKWNSLRRKHALKYSDLLKNISGVKIPDQNENGYHVFHLYVIECDKRDELQKYLSEKGIETIIHYPIPIHLQVPYRKLGFKLGDFPITEKKSNKVLSLPMFPELKNEEIRYVCDSIKQFLAFRK